MHISSIFRCNDVTFDGKNPIYSKKWHSISITSHALKHCLIIESYRDNKIQASCLSYIILLEQIFLYFFYFLIAFNVWIIKIIIHNFNEMNEYIKLQYFKSMQL